MNGRALRRKRRNSSLRLTSLKRKKTMEQIDDATSGRRYGPSFHDNKQGYNDNNSQNKDSLADSRTFLPSQTFVDADPLRRDRSSLSILPHVVKQSAPEATTYILAGTNDNSLTHLDFFRVNIEAAAKTLSPPSSFSFPSTSRNLPTTPPAPLQSDKTSTTEAFPVSSPPKFFFFSSSSSSPSPFSTPTHEPRRPPLITTAMSRRIANLNLPTGKGGAPTNVPQFLSSSTNLSTDSTDSQGSVRTQVPGSYHQQQASQLQAMQDEQWYGQIDNGALPFATPDLNSSSTFVSATPAAGKGLNPSVQPFAPPVGEGFASPSLGFANTPKAASYGPVNNGYSTQLKTTSGYGTYVPPQKQMSDYGVAVDGEHGGYDRRGSMGGYQQQNGGYTAPNPYGPGNGAVQYPAAHPYGSVQNGGPTAYDGASNHNPYGHYGQGAAMNAYGYQGHGQADNGYTNNTNYGAVNQTKVNTSMPFRLRIHYLPTSTVESRHTTVVRSPTQQLLRTLHPTWQLLQWSTRTKVSTPRSHLTKSKTAAQFNLPPAPLQE